ncbi:MAG: hypothetical protein UU74_C0033G0014 [Candidatus Woesebacteria bacterium GW2011_GWA1_41_7]|uniref:Uncharacterized protein n=1 Tax=Candidatus Woesebacteria bacterium GW2011_GWA1_41_7 TaxID=1618556 RepID=A0A0G0WXB5_9BACT|nr:MAG: hypothetical protein UU74_C0033G0014 [Candidatus Woesebacteria bacterium GW2011_GWA1_41_7]
MTNLMSIPASLLKKKQKEAEDKELVKKNPVNASLLAGTLLNRKKKQEAILGDM